MQPTRIDGYAPIADYALVGNRRTAALVALDGSVDWLCLPKLDSPSAFAAILDSRAGGHFSLAPEAPYDAERRYLPDTNVLETTFSTQDGSVRVIDAMTVQDSAPLPWNELVRRVEGLAGEVSMRWQVAPRLDYARVSPRVERRAGVPVLASGDHLLALQSFDLGEPQAEGAALSGRETVTEGGTGLLALSAFHGQALLLSRREELEERLRRTEDFWRRRAERCSYEGPWREAVVRSALALDMLVDASTQAMAGAATTSLPETIGGKRNFDYRYAWLRDGNFALEALLRLGYREEVHASLEWMLRTTSRTHPRLRPFYGLAGTPRIGEEELELPGYRDSRPVLNGNGAGGQLQLGNFGDLMETAWLYVRDGNALHPRTGQRLAEIADFVCEVWGTEDASIWELGQKHHYTQSKIACWMALDRAGRLAVREQVPAANSARWDATARAIREFVEERCWSEESRSYARFAGSDQLDASILLAARGGYVEPGAERMNATVDALRRELGRGPLLYRYSGMEDQENCFLACSFWLVEALARVGRLDEATEVMDQLVGMVSGVGLYSEQIDPETHALLGNYPQALSHLALINAAYLHAEADAKRHAANR